MIDTYVYMYMSNIYVYDVIYMHNYICIYITCLYALYVYTFSLYVYHADND